MLVAPVAPIGTSGFALVGMPVAPIGAAGLVVVDQSDRGDPRTEEAESQSTIRNTRRLTFHAVVTTFHGVMNQDVVQRTQEAEINRQRVARIACEPKRIGRRFC